MHHTCTPTREAPHTVTSAGRTTAPVTKSPAAVPTLCLPFPKQWLPKGTCWPGAGSKRAQLRRPAQHKPGYPARRCQLLVREGLSRGHGVPVWASPASLGLASSNSPSHQLRDLRTNEDQEIREDGKAGRGKTRTRLGREKRTSLDASEGRWPHSWVRSCGFHAGLNAVPTSLPPPETRLFVFQLRAGSPHPDLLLSYQTCSHPTIPALAASINYGGSGSLEPPHLKDTAITRRRQQQVCREIYRLLQGTAR